MRRSFKVLLSNAFVCMQKSVQKSDAMVSRLTKNNNVNATRLILRPKNHIHFALKKTARRALPICTYERIFFCVFLRFFFSCCSLLPFFRSLARARVSVVLEFSSNTTRPHEEHQQQRDVHEDDVLLLHRLLLPFVVVFFFSETVEASSWTTGRRRREKKEFHREIFNFSIFTAIVGGKSG